MTQIVVDASRIGNALLPDERNEFTGRLLSTIMGSQLLEPCNWPVEICGLILKGARRLRLTTEDVATARDILDAIIGSAEIETQSRAIDALDLAVRHNLSVYDAAYLEIALRTGLPLLTSDGALSRAASKRGVELIQIA